MERRTPAEVAAEAAALVLAMGPAEVARQFKVDVDPDAIADAYVEGYQPEYQAEIRAAVFDAVQRALSR